MKTTKKAAILSLFLCYTITGTTQVSDSLFFANTNDSIPAPSTEDTIKKSHFKTATNVWKNLILNTPSDFVQMKNIVTSDWKQTAAWLGGITVMVLADKPVTKFYQQHIEKSIQYNLPALPGSKSNMFFRGNDAWLNYSLIGLYTGSLGAGFEKGQRAALNSIKALTYSYLIGHVGLKAVFARQRPHPSLGDAHPGNSPFTSNPYDFFNFRKLNFRSGPHGTAFPSMHATGYFAVAKVLAMEFDNYWIPYGAITLLFCADLDAHKHWVGDMVAGGVLGTLIGKAIVENSRRQERKRNAAGLQRKRKHKRDFQYQILPAFAGTNAGVTLLASF